MCHLDKADASFRKTGDEAKLGHSPEQQRNCTSLDAEGFVWSMNESGWRQNGEFVALLSTMGYHFRKDDGRLIAKKETWQVTQALSLLIFEA